MRNLLLLTAMLTLFSCQKEVIEIGNKVMNQEDCMVFDSFEEVQATLDYLNGLEKSEIKDWENEKGFTSFNSECKIQYERVAEMKFSDQEEAISEIQKNANFIKLELNEDGEYEVEPNYEESNFGYILNSDRIFYVGDEFCKMFESEIVKTTSENASVLYRMENISTDEVDNDAQLELIFQRSIDNQHVSFRKDSEHDHGKSDVDRSEKNKVDGIYRRVKINIDLSRETYGGTYSYFVRTFRVAPQKRRGTIWWNYEAEIECEIDARVDYKDNSSNWQTSNWNADTTGVIDDVLTRKEYYYTPEYLFQSQHFGGYDAWAKTEHTGTKKAELEEDLGVINYD